MEDEVLLVGDKEFVGQATNKGREDEILLIDISLVRRPTKARINLSAGKAKFCWSGEILLVRRNFVGQATNKGKISIALFRNDISIPTTIV